MFHTSYYPRFGLLLALLLLTLLLPSPIQAAAGDWTPTGSMATPRSNHTATLLQNGKVLVVGGVGMSGSSEVVLSSAELYDPASGAWSSAGSLAAPRAGHTATLLQNGKVLVAGGYQGSDPPLALSSAELYDPQTNAWTVTGSLNQARSSHAAILLPDGKVLAAGTTAELYDPDTGTWTYTGSPANTYEYHSAVLLREGIVFMVSGWSAGVGNPLSHYQDSAELYDPAAGRWSETNPPVYVDINPTVTLLSSGEVLAAGGIWIVGPRASSALYDPLSGNWKSTGYLTDGRMDHTATRLPHGHVLAAGGRGSTAVLASAELYDPSVGLWSPASPMTTARASHTATLLRDGRVLVAGGDSGAYGGVKLASAEIYDAHLSAVFLPLVAR